MMAEQPTDSYSFPLHCTNPLSIIKAILPMRKSGRAAMHSVSITHLKHLIFWMCAAQRKNQLEGAHVVEDLVLKGADVNAYRFNDPVAFRWRAPFKFPRPVHVACEESNIFVAQALLRHGADPHRKTLEAAELTQGSCNLRAITRS